MHFWVKITTFRSGTVPGNSVWLAGKTHGWKYLFATPTFNKLSFFPLFMKTHIIGRQSRMLECMVWASKSTAATLVSWFSIDPIFSPISFHSQSQNIRW